MKKTALRTDDSRFDNLPDYPFPPHYVFVRHPGYEPLRMHYVNIKSVHANNNSTPVILLLHGCPSWSYLYRKVITGLSGKNLRIVAPDHIGCGKSDKLLERGDYSYDFYVSCLKEFIQQLDLRNIVLVCQDWGGPIGLRILSEMPERFVRVIATNTLLPNCETPPHGVAHWPGKIIRQWIDFTQQASDMPVSQIIQGVTVKKLPDEVLAAYDAPFPDARYKQGVLGWPGLIPVNENSPGIAANRRAWEFLERSNIPFLTAFSDSDPSTAAWETVFQQRIPGAKNLSHHRITQAGHMVQEDQGELLAKIILEFIFTKAV